MIRQESCCGITGTTTTAPGLCLGDHQLVARHNYVDGLNDVGSQSNNTYKFPGNFYRQNSQTN